jgi:hypothetical protein
MAKIEVIVINGRIEISIDEMDSAAQAMITSAGLVDLIKQQSGLTVKSDSGPEQHKPDHHHAHIHQRHGHGH